MSSVEFEWDPAKAISNLNEHHISFELAKRAFLDVFAVEREDISQTYDEPRFVLLGMVDARLLVVTFVYRGCVIRIISARGAEPYERRLYHEENDDGR